MTEPHPIAIEAAPHGGFVVLATSFHPGVSNRLLFAGALDGALAFAAEHFRPAPTVKTAEQISDDVFAPAKQVGAKFGEWVIKAVKPHISAGSFIALMAGHPEMTSDLDRATRWSLAGDATEFLRKAQLTDARYQVLRIRR